jgi:hypothetical protein
MIVNRKFQKISGVSGVSGESQRAEGKSYKSRIRVKMAKGISHLLFLHFALCILTFAF